MSYQSTQNWVALYDFIIHINELGASVKNDTADNLLHKEKEKTMTSQRTKQHICKSHKPTHDQNLQKSCFLADAPKPTHHPKSGQFAIWRQLLTKTRLKNLTLPTIKNELN